MPGQPEFGSPFAPLQEHLASLRWCSTPTSRPVIMIDDVFTLGRTSEACRQLVLDASASVVLVACLAKTKP
jgi:predicted amidophosphoribosyltransferase